MSRLDKERQEQLEPKRVEFALSKLELLGYSPIYTSQIKCIKFVYNGNVIYFYPYSGWHSGKGVKSGRGFENLLKQLK